MTREEILSTLATHQCRLAELHVRELALFGSHARNEATETSDIDFLVDLTVKSFDDYMDLKEFLESVFGRRVDLVLKTAIKPSLRDRIMAEAVRAA